MKLVSFIFLTTLSFLQAQLTDDTALIKALLKENLSDRSFSFATVVEATSGKKVLTLTNDPAHQRVITAIEKALTTSLTELNANDSPIRKLRRINEASKFFEDALLKNLSVSPGLTCEIPLNRKGDQQRSGYPDLRIVDTASQQVFYLDPKLVEQGTFESTFRSFYFEPKNETLKITDDAVHLLVGIEHDGEARSWTFSKWRLVDLSKLQVKLKAEFQASNAEIYRNSELSVPPAKP